MRKTLTIVAIVTALGVSGIGLGLMLRAQNAAAEVNDAVAQNDDGMGGGGMFRLMKVLHKLNLSDKQLTDVKAIIKTEFVQAEPNIHKMVDARRALRDAIQAQPTDEKLIRQRVADVAAIGSDLAIERAHVRTQIVALLTDGQKQTLMDIQKEADARVNRILEKVSERIKSDN